MSALDIIRAMEAAGCDHELILKAVRAHEEERVAKRRANDAERQRRHRAAKAVTNVTRDDRDRRDERDSNEPHIQHASTRVEDNPSRLVVSGETKNTPQSPPRGAKRGTRIPDDWQPDVLAARREGLSEPEALREGERFRDYFRAAPNAKGVKLDWPATWRNWCKNAVDRRQARGADPPKRGSAALVEALERGFSP